MLKKMTPHGKEMSQDLRKKIHFFAQKGQGYKNEWSIANMSKLLQKSSIN